MSSTVMLSSFEEASAGKKHIVEQWILSNIDYGQLKKELPVCFYRNVSFYLTELPDFRRWPPDFEARVFAVLVDGDMKEDLERGNLINWCHNVRRVVPLNVPRDGNCLLHSVATAVWGIHDNTQMLRRLLGLALNVDIGKRFHGRWLYHRQLQISKVVDRLLDSGAEAVNAEWKEISQCLEPEHSQSLAVPHRFLESIHVYTVANVLRRPVVVITDPSMRTFSGLSLQDNDMGGIYLPLEWNWADTCRTPILLSYANSHFCPLLFGDRPNQAMAGATQKNDLAPLVNGRFEQLPVRFLLPGEEPEVGELLRKYLKIKETVMQVNGSVQNILCAELETCNLPSELNLVNDYFQYCLRQFERERSTTAALLQSQYQTPLLPASATSRQERLQQMGSPNHVNKTPGSPQHVVREQFQRFPADEYSLADPYLQAAGGWGQHQISIPAPSFTPYVGGLQQSASLNRSPEKRCVVPKCKYFGDPDLGMMCSNCFKDYTIKESKRIAGGRAARPQPTAPLAPQAEEERFQMSMMSSRCKEGCGFRCSTKTYPYCHECAEKHQKQAGDMSKQAAAPSTGPRPVTGASGEASPVRMPAAVLPQEPQLNDLNRVCPASPQPFFSNTVAGISEINQEPSAAMTTAHAEGEKTAEAMSPTRVLAKGEQSAPLTPPDDSEKLMFGNGQASLVSSSQREPVMSKPDPQLSSVLSQAATGPDPFSSTKTLLPGLHHQPELMSLGDTQLQKPLLGQEPFSASAHLTQNQLAEAVVGPSNPCTAGSTCSSAGCGEGAVCKNKCPKCYMGQGLGCADPGNPTVQRLKVGLTSLTSSAPASVGPAAMPPVSRASLVEQQTHAPDRSRSPNFTQLSNKLPGPTSNTTLVQQWLNNNDNTSAAVTRREMQVPSRQLSQPLGLPERQESEPLGNDVIMSGQECGSATVRCTECNSPVQGAGPLCQQCRDILRRHRQTNSLQRHHSCVQESMPSQRQCQTEGCLETGSEACLGFCPSCYARMFKRQLEQETGHAHPANQRLTFPSSQSLCGAIAPSAPKGLPCTVAGCTRYGDPKQKGMCGKHYQQHLTGIQSSAAPVRSRSAPMARRSEININLPTASQICVTPHSTTIYAPPIHSQVATGAGDTGVYSQGELSTPPSFPTPESSYGGIGGAQELCETYNRVAIRNTSKCLTPGCENFANMSKGGYCNSCAEQERIRDEMIGRIILGDEAIG